jgi:hypothetical protein
MKVKNYIGLGMAAAVLAVAGAVPAAAQNSNCDDVTGYTESYKKIVANYDKGAAGLKVAVDTGKEYLEKYGSCTGAEGADHPAKAGVDWVKASLPGWEKTLSDGQKSAQIEELYKKYAAELAASKWNEASATSKQLLAVFPQDKNLNVIIPLASMGLYESYKKNDAFVDQAIQNAKLAIDKMKAGEVALNNYYGIAPYAYGNKDDAMSEMKYILGYLLYEKKGDKKAGLNYFYDVANNPGRNKGEPRMFVTIGLYYLDQAKKVGDEILPLVTELNAATTTPERKIELDKMIKAKEAYYQAWEERALDAFGRAHKNAKDTTPAEKAYRQNIYDQIAKIYESRFGKKDGIDSWLSTAVAKPMPNPTTDVTPVVETDAATTTTTTSSVAAPAAGAAKTATVTKP